MGKKNHLLQLQIMKATESQISTKSKHFKVFFFSYRTLKFSEEQYCWIVKLPNLFFSTLRYQFLPRLIKKKESRENRIHYSDTELRQICFVPAASFVEERQKNYFLVISFNKNYSPSNCLLIVVLIHNARPLIH